MINTPFTGKELFGIYESKMGRLVLNNLDADWDQIGKLKKAAWNHLAQEVNTRMQEELNNANSNKR